MMTTRSTEMRALAKTLLFVLAFLLAAVAHAAAQATTVVLVRHAEKADNSSDAMLSDAGTARAQSLVKALNPHDVSVIFTTQYQRTRLTAAPLAEQLKLTPVVIEATVSPQTVAQRVREHAGKTVLIVGHSNTVPALISALGGPDIGTIPDAEYDNLFIVRIDADGAVKLERSRY